MKIFNMKGEMFDASGDCSTLNIEFNSTPAIELADARTKQRGLGYSPVVRRQQARDVQALSPIELQLSRDKVANKHPESMRWHSQSTRHFGDDIMKYTLVPSTVTQRKQAEQAVKQEDSNGILHRW